MNPGAEYEKRLERWQGIVARDDRLFHVLGNCRLGVAVIAAVLAWIAFGNGILSGWWLLLPAAGFVGLVVVHERIFRRQEFGRRAVRYYERGLARVEGEWAGTGSPGDAFRDAAHVYAEDLDLFGSGSLFELISIARTAAGEKTLAAWLLAPGDRETALERQRAVAELRPGLDLREDIALLGEEVRAGIHAEALEAWGSAPRVEFPAGARLLAFALGCASLLAFAGFMAHLFGARPFLVLLLADFAAIYWLRAGVAAVSEAVEAPAHDLALLALLLERLERETFESSRLRELRAAFETQGLAASRRIARLQRWVELLDSLDNPFVRLIAPALLWREQVAMAIEAWRRDSGVHLGRWLASAGEFEALSSLAGFSFEHPAAVFPEIVSTAEPLFDAEDLGHPLISAARCVPNSLKLDANLRLLIVSGSNMSGKSTLLRAVGLNAVLAWAGAPVMARRLRVSPFQVGASIRVVDSLQEGRSRFYAEITRLRQIAGLAALDRPVLFLLDEILSGTNSHDRRIGAAAVVGNLVQSGAIGLITTHDLALVRIADELGAQARNVHFEDHLEGGEIRFDYLLKPGVVTHSNALELMRAVGLRV